jgi:hypothetical protein
LPLGYARAALATGAGATDAGAPGRDEPDNLKSCFNIIGHSTKALGKELNSLIWNGLDLSARTSSGGQQRRIERRRAEMKPPTRRAKDGICAPAHLTGWKKRDETSD